jgi:hypothetical protein
MILLIASRSLRRSGEADCRLPIADCRLVASVRAGRWLSRRIFPLLQGLAARKPHLLDGMNARVLMPCLAMVAGFVGLPIHHARGGDTATPAATFTSTTAKLSAMPDSVNVPVEWHFTNTGDLPLVVENFIESCGCLSGSMAAQTAAPVAPGKSGVIRASLTPGQHRSLLRKSLHVRFVGYEKPVELVVEAKISSPVELSTRDLIWTAEAATAAQSIDITTGTGTAFNITELSGIPDDQFHIVQETLIEKSHYRITITPEIGASSGVHTLLIRTDSPDPRDRVTAVFLRIP